MARLFMSGAETGHIHAEGLTAVSGTTAVDTTVVHSGARSFKHDSGVGNALAATSYVFTGVTEVTYFLTAWVYIPSATGYPSTNTGILRFFSTAAAILGSMTLSTTGTLQLTRQATAVGSPTAPLALDTWHRLDIKTKIGVGAVDLFEGRLNGTAFASAGPISHGDVLVANVRWGWLVAPGASKVIYIDDVILNDDTGSVNNAYPGDEKVVLLLPTADSSRDAGWTGGLVATPSTTNLFDAVNDVPPNGVAAGSATNATQIRNAVSTTTEQYSATMQTYTAAGVGAGDTVTAVQGLMELASAPNSTTQSGVQVTSNPAIAESLVTLPNVVMGTYPTGWVRGVTAMAENPAVTKGTAPVVRVRKNAASTTAHNVGLLGLLVGYVPAGAPPTAQRRRLLMMLAATLSLWRTLWPAPSR